jgi:hypothetical protein
MTQTTTTAALDRIDASLTRIEAKAAQIDRIADQVETMCARIRTDVILTELVTGVRRAPEQAVTR